MLCIVLHCTALNHTALSCIALHYTSLYHTSLHYYLPLLGNMLVGLNSQWFLRCPRSGVLHFDYVSTTRPLVGEAILLCSAVLSSPLVIYAIFYFGLLFSALPCPALHCTALPSPAENCLAFRCVPFLSVPSLPFRFLLFFARRHVATSFSSTGLLLACSDSHHSVL